MIYWQETDNSNYKFTIHYHSDSGQPVEKTYYTDEESLMNVFRFINDIIIEDGLTPNRIDIICYDQR